MNIALMHIIIGIPFVNSLCKCIEISKKTTKCVYKFRLMYNGVLVKLILLDNLIKL